MGRIEQNNRARIEHSMRNLKQQRKSLSIVKNIFILLIRSSLRIALRLFVVLNLTQVLERYKSIFQNRTQFILHVDKTRKKTTTDRKHKILAGSGMVHLRLLSRAIVNLDRLRLGYSLLMTGSERGDRYSGPIAQGSGGLVGWHWCDGIFLGDQDAYAQLSSKQLGQVLQLVVWLFLNRLGLHDLCGTWESYSDVWDYHGSS